MGISRTKYESDFNGIIFVEMSDEELVVAGTEPTGAAVSQLTAYASGSRKRNGIHARGVVLKREITDGTDTCSVSNFLVVRSPSDFGTAAYALGATVQIAGVDWEVSKQRPETQV